MDLVEFLTARLDEDEQAARVAGDDRWALIPVYEDATIRHGRMPDPQSIQIVEANGVEMGSVHRVAHAEYIARHDPARVLAEVDAKRQLLDWLAREDERALDNNLWWWDGDGARKLLALPYADHPDYDEAWRP